MVQCNSVFVKSRKRALESSSSPSGQEEKKIVVSTLDGHDFWVSKSANSLERKLPKKKIMSWNQSLGHICEKGLRAFKNKSLVEGLDDCNLEFDFWEHYVYGKQKIVFLFIPVLISLMGFWIIFIQMCNGPINFPSISISMYFLSLS